MTRTALLRIGMVGTLAFAMAHVYWAFGGRVGVPADAAPIGERPAFLAYDIASAAVLVAATVVASRLGRPEPGRAVVRATTIGAAVALLRGGVGLVQDAAGVVTGAGLQPGTVFDCWFAATGVLFLVLAADRAQATGTVSSSSARSPVAPARTPRRPNTTT